MQRLQVELISRFGRHELHGRAQEGMDLVSDPGRRPYEFGIGFLLHRAFPLSFVRQPGTS